MTSNLSTIDLSEWRGMATGLDMCSEGAEDGKQTTVAAGSLRDAAVVIKTACNEIERLAAGMSSSRRQIMEERDGALHQRSRVAQANLQLRTELARIRRILDSQDLYDPHDAHRCIHEIEEGFGIETPGDDHG